MGTTLIRITFDMLLSAIRLARTTGAAKPIGLMVDVDAACELRAIEVRSIRQRADGTDTPNGDCVSLFVTRQPTITACHELPRWIATGMLGVLFLADTAAGRPLIGRGFVRNGSGVDGIRAIHLVGPAMVCIDLSGS